MKTVSIDDVAVNTALGIDLKNDAGSMILRRGTLLSAGMITRLRKIGIKELTVASIDSSELSAEREDLLDALRFRFKKVKDSPYLLELKRIAEKRLSV